MASFQEFQQQMNPFPVFSIREIEKQFPRFDRRRLVEWQEKGYIRKLRNRFYAFQNTPVNESWLFYAANQLLQPSYISLESAFSRFGWIPEGVFQVTSCTTRKTNRFDTEPGSFIYHHLKPSLFWGYRLEQRDGLVIRFAEPEKALIDYLYLHAGIHTTEDLEALRWNREQIREQISPERLARYDRRIESPALSGRIDLLTEYLYAYA